MCMYYITGSRIVLHEILNIPIKFRRHNRIHTHIYHVGESTQKYGQIKIIFIETITLATITFAERTSVLKMSLKCKIRSLIKDVEGPFPKAQT